MSAVLSLHPDSATDSCLCDCQQVVYLIWLGFLLGGGRVSVCLWEVGLADSVNFTAFVSLRFSEVILCGKSDFHRRSISGN